MSAFGRILSIWLSGFMAGVAMSLMSIKNNFVNIMFVAILVIALVWATLEYKASVKMVEELKTFNKSTFMGDDEVKENGK